MNNIFCIECGFELPATAKFCKKCGVQIESVEAPAEVVNEITKEENIESESKPISQTPIKATPSKAMAIGTKLLEWIIIFVVAGVISLVGVVLFGAAGGSVMGFVGWLIARATMRSILKSILPLRYQDETDEEEEKEEEEVEEEEVVDEVDEEEENSEYDPNSFTISTLEAFGFVIGTIIVLAILGLIITISE